MGLEIDTKSSTITGICTMRLCVKRNLKAYRSRPYVLTELASVVLRDVGSQTIKDPIIVFHSEAIRYPVAHHLVTGDVGI